MRVERDGRMIDYAARSEAGGIVYMMMGRDGGVMG